MKKNFETWETKGIDIHEDGKFVIDKKSFDKTFNKFSEHLKEWLKTEDAVNALVKVDMVETWNKEFGNEAQWYLKNSNILINIITVHRFDRYFDIVNLGIA